MAVTAAYVQLGNTARFTVQFSDWDDVAADPDSVTFQLYSANWTPLLGGGVLLGQANRTGAGAYFYLHTVQTEGTLYWEWTGQLQGYPSLVRGSVQVKKV